MGSIGQIDAFYVNMLGEKRLQIIDNRLNNDLPRRRQSRGKVCETMSKSELNEIYLYISGKSLPERIHSSEIIELIKACF